MDEKSPKEKPNQIVVFALSGCILMLICLIIFGTTAIVGLLFSTEADLLIVPRIREVSQNYLNTDSSIIQPTAAPVLPTLPPPIIGSPTPRFYDDSQPASMPKAPSTNNSQIAFGPPPIIEMEPIPMRANVDLTNLYKLDYPEHDYYSVEIERGNDHVGPRTLKKPSNKVGDRRAFYTENGYVEATLMSMTENTYFWVDDNLNMDQEQIQQVANQFEVSFINTLNHLFGIPWQPGVDGDPHISILHLAGNGDLFELGYFSDQDEYPQSIFSESNEQEIVYLNMGHLILGSDLYFGTLIHELQHLNQWNLDKNESTWMNEGFSQLAEHYVGLDTAIPDAYLSQPNVRLDRWEYNNDVIDAHYGNSYLFSVYILEQLGEEALYDLIRHQENGLGAVKKILEGFRPDITLEQFIADWATANLLDDGSAGSQYAYLGLDFPDPAFEAQIQQLPFDQTFELDQLGVHYIDIDQQGSFTLTFSGDTIANLIDFPPPSGEQMWYAPPANDTNAQLTAYFDLRQLNQATLNYKVWFDLEDDFDYAYLSVSTDQGATWNPIHNGIQGITSIDSYYTGKSSENSQAMDGWIQASVSLTPFVGNEILLRFSVLTDFKGFGQGFAIDDVSIPELNYINDFESFDPNWKASGFLQTGWLLPQQWAVRFISNGETSQILDIHLDSNNQSQQYINLGPEGGTLMVLPLTPFTTDTARYWLKLEN